MNTERTYSEEKRLHESAGASVIDSKFVAEGIPYIKIYHGGTDRWLTKHTTEHNYVVLDHFYWNSDFDRGTCFDPDMIYHVIMQDVIGSFFDDDKEELKRYEVEELMTKIRVIPVYTEEEIPCFEDAHEAWDHVRHVYGE